MAKKTISFDVLDVKSLNNAIKEVEQYSKDIEYSLRVFVKSLAAEGVEVAKMGVITYNAIFTTELLNSIHVEEKSNGVFVVKTDSKHAAFVEFGTGQVGQAHHYPYKLPDGVSWEYNVGSTIFEIHDGQYGWFYKDAKGRWFFTQGMESRPFMYHTALYLKDIVERGGGFIRYDG